MQGKIRKLVHLSAGTDLPTTHLVASMNGVGYGYVASLNGDVFFDYAAVKNRRFDQLVNNMAVEYVLDDAPYLRASSVTVIAEKADAMAMAEAGAEAALETDHD